MSSQKKFLRTDYVSEISEVITVFFLCTHLCLLELLILNNKSILATSDKVTQCIL